MTRCEITTEPYQPTISDMLALIAYADRLGFDHTEASLRVQVRIHLKDGTTLDRITAPVALTLRGIIPDDDEPTDPT